MNLLITPFFTAAVSCPNISLKVLRVRGWRQQEKFLLQGIFSGVVYRCKENDTRGTDLNHTGPQALHTYRTLFGTNYAHSCDTEERRECKEVMCLPQIPRLVSVGGRIHRNQWEVTEGFPPLSTASGGGRFTTQQHCIESEWIGPQTPISLRCSRLACWLHDHPPSFLAKA